MCGKRGKDAGVCHAPYPYPRGIPCKLKCCAISPAVCHWSQHPSPGTLWVGVTQRHEYQEEGIIGDHLRGCLPALPNVFIASSSGIRVVSPVPLLEKSWHFEIIPLLWKISNFKKDKEQCNELPRTRHPVNNY